MLSPGAKTFNSRIIKTGVIASALMLVLFMQGCSDMHTLVWNKAESVIDGHKVIIHSCRNSYTRTESDTPTNRQHVFGCANRITVEIRNDDLTVNGKGYGMLNKGDSVEVKGDKVFINKKEAVEIARK